mmetsp:Transcript_8121/g.26778  ORF Transcript_8121/g.26778 Transcript_8121/m.26778 type:complete len:214 (+) Transcript_8121:884-1525(+)
MPCASGGGPVPALGLGGPGATSTRLVLAAASAGAGSAVSLPSEIPVVDRRRRGAVCHPEIGSRGGETPGAGGAAPAGSAVSTSRAFGVRSCRLRDWLRETAGAGSAGGAPAGTAARTPRFHGHFCGDTSTISPGGGSGPASLAAPKSTNRPPPCARGALGTLAGSGAAASDPWAGASGSAAAWSLAPALWRWAAAAATAKASRGCRPSSSRAV